MKMLIVAPGAGGSSTLVREVTGGPQENEPGPGLDAQLVETPA